MANNLEKIYQDIKEARSSGQKLADWFTEIIGTWTFILIQSILLVIWVALNVTAYINHWDPYPFILLNLVLSMQAAYAAPIIMMSQNRQNAKDRIKAQLDYKTNEKAEQEVEEIQQYLHRIECHKLEEIKKSIEELQEKINK